MRECELCGGPLVVLGVLGNVAHCRCRDCGAQCSEVYCPESMDMEMEIEDHE